MKIMLEDPASKISILLPSYLANQLRDKIQMTGGRKMTKDGRITNESLLINDNRCFVSRVPPLLLLKSEILLFEKEDKRAETSYETRVE
jgi:hypothetical protein